jgi:hypothetical protein
MSSGLAYRSTLALAALVLASVVVAFFDPIPAGMFFSGSFIANAAGFLAFFLISASGVMMLFRRTLLRRFRDTSLLRGVHVWLAASGGAFLVVHVAFFLFFPLSPPVLFGYLATYVGFMAWLTGLTFLEDLRGSLFYHSLLSLIITSLLLVHVFSAGRDVPATVSGVVLVVAATVVLLSAVKQFAQLPDEGAGARPRQRKF